MHIEYFIERSARLYEREPEGGVPSPGLGYTSKDGIDACLLALTEAYNVLIEVRNCMTFRFVVLG